MPRVPLPKTVEGLKSLLSTIVDMKKDLDVNKNLSSYKSYATAAASKLGKSYSERVLILMRALEAFNKTVEKNRAKLVPGQVARREDRVNFARVKLMAAFNKKKESIQKRITALGKKAASPKKKKSSAVKKAKKSSAVKKAKKSPSSKAKKSKSPKKSASPKSALSSVLALLTASKVKKVKAARKPKSPKSPKPKAVKKSPKAKKPKKSPKAKKSPAPSMFMWGGEYDSDLEFM